MDVTAIYIRQLRKLHRQLSREEEAELALKAKRGDHAARETLMLSVMPMAVRLAQKYQGRGLPIDDLIQSANQGVIRAVDKFDPNRGCRLTTYATWWIKQSLLRDLAIDTKLIHVPLYVFGNDNLGEFTPEQLEQFRKLNGSLTSLDVQAGDDKEVTPAALVEEREHELIEQMERKRELAILERNIRRLRPRQQEILRARLAGRTLLEIGKTLGITRERVRQIESGAKQELAWMYGIKLES